MATFSDDVGAIAFYSNALLQESLGTSAFRGIYWLSQSVAESALLGIKTASQGETGGFLSGGLFFATAQKAWQDANQMDHFPGNLLTLDAKGAVSEGLGAIQDFA